jgi:iron complex outermembrane receptor protein
MDRLEAIDDIARFTPGLTASFFNNTQPIIAVRGANNTFSQAGASKPVGVFIDGVFVARYSVASFDLFDLQQVAVLRGPQGTLFGRNVTGGAIQIVTERPSLEQPQLKFKAGAANYDG